MNYQQFVDSLTEDEWMLLTGLAYIFAGADEPISPLSSEFAKLFGVEDAKAARRNLIAKGIIDDHYEILDKVFRSWIWKEIFAVPRKQARIYNPCDRLEDRLCGS